MSCVNRTELLQGIWCKTLARFVRSILAWKFLQEKSCGKRTAPMLSFPVPVEMQPRFQHECLQGTTHRSPKWPVLKNPSWFWQLWVSNGCSRSMNSVFCFLGKRHEVGTAMESRLHHRHCLAGWPPSRLTPVMWPWSCDHETVGGARPLRWVSVYLVFFFRLLGGGGRHLSAVLRPWCVLARHRKPRDSSRPRDQTGIWARRPGGRIHTRQLWTPASCE